MSDDSAVPVAGTANKKSDGAITLGPNPWGTSATWADYDWRGMAESARLDHGRGNIASKVFDAIAEAVEADAGDLVAGTATTDPGHVFDMMVVENVRLRAEVAAVTTQLAEPKETK